jgi:hypothetical protein
MILLYGFVSELVEWQITTFSAAKNVRELAFLILSLSGLAKLFVAAW